MTKTVMKGVDREREREFTVMVLQVAHPFIIPHLMGRKYL